MIFDHFIKDCEIYEELELVSCHLKKAQHATGVT